MTVAALLGALLLLTPAAPAEGDEAGPVASSPHEKAKPMTMWHPIYRTSETRWSRAYPSTAAVPVFRSDPLSWPAAIAARARGLVAARWGADSSAVVLEWGAVDAPWTPEGTVPLSLSGTGRGGWWTLHLHAEEEGRDDFAVRIRAGVAVPTPVASRRLQRETVLEVSDIQWTEIPVWGPPGEISERVVEPGWVTRRLVRKGEVLAPPTVDRPVLVEGGHDVEILWERGSVSLKLRGRAVQSGAMGERVWVRTESGQRLQGTVDGPGRVVIAVGGEAVA